ncbi:uncharacterized protein PgNI_06909 [Pyricularia grisea]|uniref:Large ribosomal subunit protein uL4m n=1 Tax=Pyricularia grisea TaxID=148305 RepID=A0A6P8B3E6_PYRGI|nr:uncharacterized protein PgNI_06909 [Pyricularia grisea]TLD09367.1 hypothetical protein PgNI_06909 [Pyricularia grisea]
MAGKGVRCLSEAMRTMRISLSLSPARQSLNWTKPLASSLSSRTMATTSDPTPFKTKLLNGITGQSSAASAQPIWTPPSEIPVTIYDFPSLEPLTLEAWPTKHLDLPFRRDLLHLAVTYEGDGTRQGTASSKTKWDVHGSHRKMAPQKGMGAARVGWKQSPLRRGGGKSHGPHPRDFSTRMNHKVYDLAWRTALSYRYRRGELFVVRDGSLDMPLPADFLTLAAEGRLGRELEDGFVDRMVRETLNPLGWGKEGGRSTFVVGCDKAGRPNLFSSLEIAQKEARALEVDDVDVKDILETGRIVIERRALKRLIKEHQSDLVSRIVINGSRVTGPLAGSTRTLVE